MKHLSLREKYWGTALLWTALIYATLPVMWPVSQFLKTHTPFPLLVNSILLSTLLSLLTVLYKKGKINNLLSLSLLFLSCGGYVSGLFILRYPAERMHFLEYGFLAFLVFRALRIDLTERKSYVAAALLTFFLGWIDERIQFFIPNRYCQFQDVILNGISGILALILVFLFRRAKKPGTAP